MAMRVQRDSVRYQDHTQRRTQRLRSVQQESEACWLGFGTAEPERMYKSVHGLHGELEQAGIKQVYYKSRGTAHEWQTWRRDLNDSARRLFQ
jgi:enterochelin esterase-like enzyme